MRPDTPVAMSHWHERAAPFAWWQHSRDDTWIMDASTSWPGHPAAICCVSQAARAARRGQSKRGGRFSRNAAMPSRASGVWLEAAMSSIA